jgi:hypothetical protein
MSNDSVQGQPFPASTDNTVVESNFLSSFTEEQFLITDATLGNTASDANITVTCDQLSDDSFSLH